MDVDLYQTQKALDNAKWALKPGGTLIFVSKCREGIGDEVFYKQLARSKDPDQVLRNLATEYKLGYHKAAKMAEMLKWAKIFGVTSLPDEKLGADKHPSVRRCPGGGGRCARREARRQGPGDLRGQHARPQGGLRWPITSMPST